MEKQLITEKHIINFINDYIVNNLDINSMYESDKDEKFFSYIEYSKCSLHKFLEILFKYFPNNFQITGSFINIYSNENEYGIKNTLTMQLATLIEHIEFPELIRMRKRKKTK